MLFRPAFAAANSIVTMNNSAAEAVGVDAGTSPATETFGSVVRTSPMRTAITGIARVPWSRMSPPLDNRID